MCTGSGCILLSLLKYSNECEGIGVDISEDALLVARENASRLGIAATFLQGDLFAPLEGRGIFDMIVSNPPYIETSVIDTLMPEVREHEPITALDGSEDGLHFYREIVSKARDYLGKSGYLFFEIGYNQGEAVSKLMTDAGFSQVEVFKDYAGLDRVVFGVNV
jgi:release factor glutamine methyltransferase